MITKLAIWYLRKKKVSVLMGFTTHKGSVQPNNNQYYLRDNTFQNTTLFNQNGEKLDWPTGFFSWKEDKE